MKTILDTLRYNLRRLRAARRITQDNLAEAAGFSEGYIRQLETGKTWMGVEAIERLARALECPPEEFFRPRAAEISPMQALETLGDFIKNKSHSYHQWIPYEIIEILEKIQWNAKNTAIVKTAIESFMTPVLRGRVIASKKSTK